MIFNSHRPLAAGPAIRIDVERPAAKLSFFRATNLAMETVGHAVGFGVPLRHHCRGRT